MGSKLGNILGRKLSLLWVFITLIVLSFQNCSLGSSAVPSSRSQKSQTIGLNSSAQGGEEGYEGKIITYIGHSPEGECSNGSAYESLVKVDPVKGVAIFAYENCEEVQGGRIVSSDTLGILPHNKDNFTEGAQVFERLDDPTRSAGELFAYCRGFTNSGTYLVDAIIRKNSSGKYYGRIIGGKYDSSGLLINTRETGFKEIIRWSNPNYPLSAGFNFYDENGKRDIHMTIKGLGETDGSMAYHQSTTDTPWENIHSFPCVRLGL